MSQFRATILEKTFILPSSSSQKVVRSAIQNLADPAAGVDRNVQESLQEIEGFRHVLQYKKTSHPPKENLQIQAFNSSYAANFKHSSCLAVFGSRNFIAEPKALKAWAKP